VPMPTSPNTTMVASSAPSIKAADLNDDATYLSRIYAILGFTVPTVGVNAPQWAFVEEALRQRFSIDHNGFPGGKVNVLREGWQFPWQVNAAAAATPDLKWKVAAAAGGSRGFVQTLAPSITTPPYGGNLLSIGFGNGANTDVYSVGSGVQLVCAGMSAISWAIEFDLAPDGVGANGAQISAGLGDTQDINAAAEYLRFSKASAAANWTFECKSAAMAVTSLNATGVPPKLSATGLQRGKIEVHGSATPYGVFAGGAMVRAFLDDVLVATLNPSLPSTLVIPTTPLYLGFYGACTVALGSCGTLYVGKTTLATNTMA
jgi:hypothetical protein